jgi:universal stress protein E
MELNKILVVIEADADEQPALTRAVQLAEKSGAGLELILADFNAYLEDGFYFDPVQAKQLRYEHGDQRLSELESLAEPLRKQGLEVSALTAWGNPPHAEIVRRVTESKPDLVLKSTRHHNKIARLLLSNADWELVRYCPAPLMLVKGGDWPEAPLFLASVDPDHVHDKPASLDQRIIAAARGLASAFSGSVRLFHSAWIPPLSGVFPLKPDSAAESKKLQELADSNGLSAEACHWSDEEISESLPAYAAESGASVVVMGAISRSRLDRILIGNTAEKVLDALECDVLVIKPEKMPAQSQIFI